MTLDYVEGQWGEEVGEDFRAVDSWAALYQVEVARWTGESRDESEGRLWMDRCLRGTVRQSGIHCSREKGRGWWQVRLQGKWRPLEDLYVALRSLDYTHWWKKRKILGMIYAEFWSRKISVLSGGRRIRHLVVSPGGRSWGHKPGQYCRDRYEGAKSGTRNEASAEPIITTDEGEESLRMTLLYLPNMTGDQFHSILRQCRTGENIGSSLASGMCLWYILS